MCGGTEDIFKIYCSHKWQEKLAQSMDEAAQEQEKVLWQFLKNFSTNHGMLCDFATLRFSAFTCPFATLEMSRQVKEAEAKIDEMKALNEDRPAFLNKEKQKRTSLTFDIFWNLTRDVKSLFPFDIEGFAAADWCVDGRARHCRGLMFKGCSKGLANFKQLQPLVSKIL